jgi:hypothetical protein
MLQARLGPGAARIAASRLVPRAFRLSPLVSRLVALLLGITSPVAAQIPRSQLAGLSQNLAGTQIDLAYRRPSARGRELFGALVPWDKVWTPSADSAVRFTTSGPLEVNGTALAAGSYSLWTKPNAKEWEFIFNSDPNVFHLRHADEKDVVKVKSVPETAEPAVETLSFYFSAADGDSATLRLQWGKTSVPLRIRARRP